MQSNLSQTEWLTSKVVRREKEGNIQAGETSCYTAQNLEAGASQHVQLSESRAVVQIQVCDGLWAHSEAEGRRRTVSNNWDSTSLSACVCPGEQGAMMHSSRSVLHAERSNRCSWTIPKFTSNSFNTMNSAKLRQQLPVLSDGFLTAPHPSSRVPSARAGIDLVQWFERGWPYDALSSCSDQSCSAGLPLCIQSGQQNHACPKTGQLLACPALCPLEAKSG